MSVSNISGLPSFTPVFLWVGDYHQEGWHPKFNIHKTIDENVKKIKKIDLIVLSLPEKLQDAALIELRSSTNADLSFIYTTHASPLSKNLSNGLFNSNNIDKELDLYLLRKKAIKLNSKDAISHKLLCFLYLFPDYILKPAPYPETPELYVYPLLQAFGQENKDIWETLDQLSTQKLITSKKLLDRVRQCNKCDSGHINYIDLCPQCRSIDIDMLTSLHCFNCGHVDRQDIFYRSGKLSCPNCLQQLRHIGVDYDRPIENQHCNSCNSFFIDARVEARCFDCNHTHQPDELKVKRIDSFQISDLGRDFVRNGVLQSMLSLMGEHMSRSQFFWLLQWNNQLALRHNHEHLLISLSLHAKDSEGMENILLSRMDAMKERLLSILRVTDACNSHDNQGILLLLPFTSKNQLPTLKKKLAQLSTSLHEEGMNLSIKMISLPDKDLDSDSEAWLSIKLQQAEAVENE